MGAEMKVRFPFECPKVCGRWQVFAISTPLFYLLAGGAEVTASPISIRMIARSEEDMKSMLDKEDLCQACRDKILTSNMVCAVKGGNNEVQIISP